LWLKMVSATLKWLVVSSLLLMMSCQAMERRTFYGTASWYGPGFHGRRTASGERFDMNRSTVASRHLPFGTRLRLTNTANGKTAIVTVNDRGPYHGGRVLDCSYGAAKRLGFVKQGTARLKVEVLHRPKTQTRHKGAKGAKGAK
jgi:rare lipoprotein A